MILIIFTFPIAGVFLGGYQAFSSE
jgi:hypothetical protein